MEMIRKVVIGSIISILVMFVGLFGYILILDEPVGDSISIDWLAGEGYVNLEHFENNKYYVDISIFKTSVDTIDVIKEFIKYSVYHGQSRFIKLYDIKTGIIVAKSSIMGIKIY